LKYLVSGEARPQQTKNAHASLHPPACSCVSITLLASRNAHNGSAVKYWEIIADNLSKAGWSWGRVSAIDSNGRTIWIADAHRDGKRYVVRTNEKLTAFVELESAVRAAKT